MPKFFNVLYFYIIDLVLGFKFVKCIAENLQPIATIFLLSRLSKIQQGVLKKITMLLVSVITLTNIKLFSKVSTYKTLVMFISLKSIFTITTLTPWMVWFSLPTVLMFLSLLLSPI